ncbi:hypothetical protein G9A89_008881 [Geosiphon pyriformis]|nr:hypothetical protein G9A89_008881 [Geosiphon pyriformis]
MLDTPYISQRAANAIIADVAPYRISSEALKAINTFLDEFLYLLIDAAHSLDLVRIKAAIGTVLPTSVGKRAVLEAELELKTYVESGNSDNTKEKTIDISPFPLQKVFNQFRMKCQYFSTLGDRGGADEYDSDMLLDSHGSDGIHIAPSLAIYLTAVLEYVGENILFLVAKTSEKHKVEVAKAKEVYIALSEDPQISSLFLRMELKSQMEEQNGFTSKSSGQNSNISFQKHGSYTSPTSQGFISRNSTDSVKSRNGSFSPQLPKNRQNSGNGTRKPSMDGMGSIGGSKSFKRTSIDIKTPRSTRSMQSLGSSGEKEADMKSISSMEDNQEKMKSFEQLINSSQTMKVSLTPNRLITIESHKRPPKLAPREPVARERIIPPNGSTLPTNNNIEESDEDDWLPHKGRKPEKETLYEFLKNSSPEDVFGKSSFKNKTSNKDSHNRRVKSIDQLETVPERQPTSSRHIPLLANHSNSVPNSPFIYPPAQLGQNTQITFTRTSSISNRKTPSTSTSLSGSNIKSKHTNVGQLESRLARLGEPLSTSKPKQRPSQLNLEDDDDDDSIFLDEGQKKLKRRHQAQDLMDFLATTPPSEKTTFAENDGLSKQTDLSAVPVNAKKKKKLKKLFGRFRKPSFSDEQSVSEQRLTSHSNVSFETSSSNSTSPINSLSGKKQPRYVQIKIPQLPKPEENPEPSIFDQIEIQGRHSRHLSKTNSMSSSTRSPQSTPNRATFSGNYTDRKPTVMYDEEHDGHSSIAAKSSQFSILTQAGSSLNKPTQSTPTTSITSVTSLSKQSSSCNTLQTYSSRPVSQSSSKSRRSSSPQPPTSVPIRAKQTNVTVIQKLEQSLPISSTPSPPQRQNSTKITMSNQVEREQAEVQKRSASPRSPISQGKSRNSLSPPLPIAITPTPNPTAATIINKFEESIRSTTNSLPNKVESIVEDHKVKLSEPTLPVKITVTPQALDHLRKRVGRSPSIDDAVKIVEEFVDEMSTEVIREDYQNDSKIFESEDEDGELADAVEDNEEEELEEALIVEWLLGTSFGFKSTISYTNMLEIDDSNTEDDDDEYVEAVDVQMATV